MHRMHVLSDVLMHRLIFLTGWLTFSFTRVLLNLLPEMQEGECAPYAASSAPAWCHLLSLRKVMSPGHSGKVRFALHLALSMFYRGDLLYAA